MKTLQVFTKLISITSFLSMVLLFWGIATLVSCHQGKYSEVLSSLKALDPEMKSNQFYIIIPNQGCDGCISNMEDFVYKNYKTYKNVKFIFTKITSKKILKVKLGEEILRHENVILDLKDDIFFPEKEKEIYPMIVCVKNKRISDIFFQSPFEDGIGKLTTEIITNENQ